jgi:hypothetical protein
VKATPLLAVAVIALVLGAGQGAKGATQQCAPCLELEAFTIDGHYRESRFENGVLVLIGRLEVAAQVRARLHFGNVAPPRATWQSRPLSLPAGDFAERMDLPPTLLPGPYVLEVVTTLNGGVEQRTFDSVRIPAPPEGVVILAWATPDRSGFTHHPRIKGRPTQVWAYFRFASSALPRTGTKLSVQWIAPGGRAIAAPLHKPRRYEVATFVRSAQGLPAGRWSCLLRARGIVVKRVRFRIG